MHARVHKVCQYFKFMTHMAFAPLATFRDWELAGKTCEAINHQPRLTFGKQNSLQIARAA